MHSGIVDTKSQGSLFRQQEGNEQRAVLERIRLGIRQVKWQWSQLGREDEEDLNSSSLCYGPVPLPQAGAPLDSPQVYTSKRVGMGSRRPIDK